MKIISDWIFSSYENQKLSFNSCLFISGNSGIGKSYIINKIATDLELFIINIDSNNCSSSSQLSDLLLKAFVSSLIQILTNNNKKKIIIIDDFEILMAIDNTINICLYNFILNNQSKFKHIPIIIIINNDLIKKIGEIKKKCKIIELPKMEIDDIYKILLIYNEKLTLNETIKIIDETNGNLANAIKIVNKTNYNNNDDLIITEDLFGNKYDRNKFKSIILKEQWIIPLNFHENLIIELINNRKGIKKEKEDFYKKFIINFCYFDFFINNNNDIGIDFFITSIAGLFKFDLKKNKNKKKGNFTKMLSYLSLQKKNNKNSYKSTFPINQFGNYHLMMVNKKFNY